jgi:hypothetical protein
MSRFATSLSRNSDAYIFTRLVLRTCYTACSDEDANKLVPENNAILGKYEFADLEK